MFLKNFQIQLNGIFTTKRINQILLALTLIGITIFISTRPDIFLRTPAGADTLGRMNDFITTFRSILIQSLPFLVLGVGISTFVAIFFKEEWIVKILPKNRFLSHFMVSFFGIFMPVCECGNVPVARRLIFSGFSVSQAFTFLLAAPVINPITIITTFEAFRGIYPDNTVIYGRIFGALLIANLVGIILSYKGNQFEFLTEKFYKEVCEHVPEPKQNRLKKAIDIFQREFIIVASTLTIGALIAAASQTLISRDIILSIGQNPLLSILAMILFSFVISICSSVDAFLVIGYTPSFTQGAILAYLVFGPMIDIKILTMLKSSFKTQLLIIVAGIVTIMAVMIGLTANLI